MIISIVLLIVGILTIAIGLWHLWVLRAFKEADQAILKMEQRLTKEKLDADQSMQDTETARQMMHLADAEWNVSRQPVYFARGIILTAFGAVIVIAAVVWHLFV